MSLEATIILRVSDEVRDALERAAADDERTASAYVRKVLMDHLRTKGYLEASTPSKRPRKG